MSVLHKSEQQPAEAPQEEQATDLITPRRSTFKSYIRRALAPDFRRRNLLVMTTERQEQLICARYHYWQIELNVGYLDVS